MTFTDCGTKVTHDWIPLALANGLEWANQRRGRGDRLDNLYRRHWGLNGILWYVGAVVGIWYAPGWISQPQKSPELASVAAKIARAGGEGKEGTEG